MIISECPYACGETNFIPCADKTPCFSKEKCEGCGKEYWLKDSRFVPEAYTLEEFAAKYTVDQETKQIKDLQPTDREATTREILQAEGFTEPILNLADMLRGERDSLLIDMANPEHVPAAEWFLRFLVDQQDKIRWKLAHGRKRKHV